MPSRFPVIVVLLCLLVSPLRGDELKESKVGHTVDDFTLDTCFGKTVSLSDFDDKKAVAIVFLGTECPLAKLYGPRLAKLQDKYRDSGVVIVGINSNTQDSITELVAYTNKHQINFPMLKDVGNRVADAMGAERTPEAFLLDADHTIRYHGRIDDEYQVGRSKERDVHPDLSIAIDQLLAGDSVAVAETEADGCHIGRVKSVEPTGDITYSGHIAAIFNARCVSCHRETEIAPFTLQSYDDVLGWEDTILEVIDDQRMPPWYANPDHGQFANDARMTPEEKELIATWIDNGMPEGDPSLLPEPPKFTDGWKIPKPTNEGIIEMPEPFRVPADGTVDYQYITIDPKWDEDKYVYAAEARPGNRSVVHHIIAYVIPPGARDDDKKLGRMLVGYAPGSLPTMFEDGTAIYVKAGSKLKLEMHYTPNGYATEDTSKVGFCFMDKSEVKHELSGHAAMDREFEIPANTDDYAVPADLKFKQDEMLLSMTPHMHLRGKSFRYVAKYPDGKSEILLDVPEYDFNWQLKYILKEPKRMPKGTVIECVGVFDNSEDNIANPDPSKTVTWGQQSYEEMMIGFVETVPAKPVD